MNKVPSLSPLQVLYYPSTQQTVDFLLEKGADVTAKNQDGATPASLAEDKDLKQVLKDLRRAAGRKKLLSSSVDLYKNSPDLKRKVWDRALAEARAAQPIMVVYNAPVAAPCSPGLLKRRRDPADQVCLLISCPGTYTRLTPYYCADESELQSGLQADPVGRRGGESAPRR